MMKNILILSAGRRVELVAAFKTELGIAEPKARVWAADMRPELSSACQVADASVSVPRVTADGYPDFLIDLCTANGIGMVIPTIDTELLPLALAADRFAANGIHLIVSSPGLVRTCRDKRKTAELFAGIDMTSPEIYARDAIKFPCFAKPFDGSCSVGAAAIMSPDCLTSVMLEDERMMFMQLVDDSFSEFTVDAYYDKEGALRCAVPRQRLETRSGEVSKGITRKRWIYDYLLPRLSRIEGARGCLTIQVFGNVEKGLFFALEINPRFGGGYPLSYSAGANYPAWLIREYFGNGTISFFDQWEPNLLMLRYDAKILVREANGSL